MKRLREVSHRDRSVNGWVRSATLLLGALLTLVACESEVGGEAPGSASSTGASTPRSGADAGSAPSTAATSTTSTSVPMTTTTTAVTSQCLDAEMMQPSDTVLTHYAICNFDTGTWLYPVYRPGDETPTLEQALSALVVGMTPAERAFGLSTGFDFVPEADQIEVVAEIDADGIAHVDFRIGDERWDPGSRAGTSHQLFSFLDPLEATVFHHPEVLGLDRSTLCWGESACEGISSRATWEGMLLVNAGVLTHGGCSPELARWYPNQCTLEGVLAESALTATVADVPAGDTLNVRAGPGVEYFRTGELAPGAVVRVTDESALATDGGTWRLTELGWVNASFLDLPTREPVGLPDTPQVRSAVATLEVFLNSMHTGDYPTASDLYAGGFDEVIDWNPGIDSTDRVALLEAACHQLVCDLRIRSVVSGLITNGTYQFWVELETPGGELFTRGPCCGDEAGSPPETQFPFAVVADDGTFRVTTLPVYVP